MTSSTATAVKDSRLNIRCDTQARALLDRAAAYSRVSVSEFVLKNALATAEAVVQHHESITLAGDDFQAFLSALDAPVKPNAALKRALKRHAERVC
jgi:uncharacterized protein (DUF1778 family)